MALSYSDDLAPTLKEQSVAPTAIELSDSLAVFSGNIAACSVQIPICSEVSIRAASNVRPIP